MLIGIGTDILEIERIKKSVDNNKFMSTYYTVKEIEYINGKKNKAETACAIFCGKEAVSKAIGTGFSGFMPKDIEILHNLIGKPEVYLSEKAMQIAKKRGIETIHISLTHCKQYAAAFATAEGGI